MPVTAFEKLRRTDDEFKLGLLVVDLVDPYLVILRRLEECGEGSKSDMLVWERLEDADSGMH